MRKPWVAGLVVVLALAGCTDDGASPSEAEEDGGDGIVAPTWSIGDSWTYENTDADGSASVMTIVVTGEDGPDYIVDTNEPTVAYFDALTDISYLGEVRKSDLAGSQGGDRVQYFDFPLEVGKTWSTAWDGERVDVEVTQVAGGQVSMMASTQAGVFAQYTYSVADRFIGEIVFFDENGTMSFRMELSDTASGFTGTVYRYTIHDQSEYGVSDAGSDHQELSWDEEVNEVWFQSVADCGQATAGRIGSTLTTRGPDEPFVPQIIAGTKESHHGVALDCSPGAEARAETTLEIDPDLVYDLEFGAAAEGGTVTVTVEPRTLQAIDVAA